MSAIDKIRALLATAEHKNTPEHERGNALRLAQRLMLKHSISRDDVEEVKAVASQLGSFDDRWQMDCATAAAQLYGCIVLVDKQLKFRYIGRAENIDATAATTESFTRYVEAEYKHALPKGLTTTERAKFRRDFKNACALVINQRVAEICSFEHNEAASTGTDLVLLQHRDQLESEARDLIAAKVGETTTPRDHRRFTPSLAMVLGMQSGERAELQRKI